MWTNKYFCVILTRKGEDMKNKTTLFLILICIGLPLVFSGCFSPWASETEKGTFSIVIGGGGGRNVLSWDEDTDISKLDHTITLTNGSAEIIREGVKTGQTVQFTVDPGKWDITIKAYLGTELKAEGFASVNIKTGSNGSVPITMGPPGGFIFSVNIDIIAPVKDETPNIEAASTEKFTVDSVSWSPPDDPFLGGKVYTVHITLTAKDGYTFAGLSTAAVNGQNAAVSINTGSSVTFSYTFPATNTKTVTAIKIKKQPVNMTYTHDDSLDLTGLEVTLTYDDYTTEDVAAGNFANKNITTIPAAGSKLSSEHDGKPVEIIYGNLTDKTGNLTVLSVNSGDGSELNPFLVRDLTDLSHVGNPTSGGVYDNWTLDKHYKQTVDIDLSGVDWTPIGDDINGFLGVYDGNNKTINNLQSSNGGLFFVNRGTVKNVGIVNCKITGKGYLGGVAGSNEVGGTVQNCYVTGEFISQGDVVFVGGIVGENRGGTVKNCYVTGELISQGGVGYVGGVVGLNYWGRVEEDDSIRRGVVQNCYFSGKTSVAPGPSTTNGTGGVVSANQNGTVQNCYATGEVQGGRGTFGVVGTCSSNGTIQNCVALNSNINYGGVVSDASGGNVRLFGRISYYLNSGEYNNNNILTNNYGRNDMKWNGNDYDWDNLDDSIDGADITVSNWNSATWWIYNAEFDQNVWNIENGKLPTLKNMPAGTQNPQITTLP